MGLVQRAIGAGSLQARALITRQLSHLPTPKQSRGSREARGQRTQAARAPRRSRSSLWLAWPVQRPQSWAQQSLARPRGREWSGDARCSQVRSQQPPHRDPRGNRCSALRDLRPGLPASRRTALEPARTGDRSVAPWVSCAPKDPGTSLRFVSWGAAPDPPPGLCLGSWSRRGRGARLPSSGLSAFAPPPGGPGRGGWGSRAPGSPFPPGHSRHRGTGENRGRAASPRCIHLPGWARPGCGGSPAPSGGSQEGSGLTSRLCGQVRSGSHSAVHPGRGGDLGRTWSSDAATATHSR